MPEDVVRDCARRMPASSSAESTRTRKISIGMVDRPSCHVAAARPGLEGQTKPDEKGRAEEGNGDLERVKPRTPDHAHSRYPVATLNARKVRRFPV